MKSGGTIKGGVLEVYHIPPSYTPISVKLERTSVEVTAPTGKALAVLKSWREAMRTLSLPWWIRSGRYCEEKEPEKESAEAW